MSKPTWPTAPMDGYRLGLDLIREAVGDKPFYTFDDHVAARLPMVVACTGCTMTMVGAGALIDRDGQCWCADCAEIRGGA